MKHLPLRGRILRGIDRRFFRQKYNAEQTIASFAAIASREVVLEPLAIALWLAARGDRD